MGRWIEQPASPDPGDQERLERHWRSRLERMGQSSAEVDRIVASLLARRRDPAWPPKVEQGGPEQ